MMPPTSAPKALKRRILARNADMWRREEGGISVGPLISSAARDRPPGGDNYRQWLGQSERWRREILTIK